MAHLSTTSVRRTLLMIGLMMCVEAALGRSCFPSPHHRGPEDRAEFIESVISSLGKLKEVRDTMEGLQRTKDAQDFFGVLDVANESLSCSAKYMDEYKKSQNQAVAMSATSLQNMSIDMLLMNGIVKRNMIDELNGSGAGEKAGDKAARMAEVGSAYRKIWDRLHMAVASVILGLYEANPRTTKMERLAITSVERNKINRQLLTEFPQIKSGKPAALKLVESAAYLLHDVLNEKKWLLHEQPFLGQ